MKKPILIILTVLIPMLSFGANLKSKTPEQVYEIYLKAVKKGDVDTVFECLSGEGTEPLPSKVEMKQMLPEARKLAPVSYKIVSKSENGNQLLTLTATGRALNPFTMKRDDANGTIQMAKEDGVWKIISDMWMPKDMESQMQGFADSFTDSFSDMTNSTPVVTYHFENNATPQAEKVPQVEEPFGKQLAAYEKKVEKIQSLSASDKYKAQQIRKAASDYFSKLKKLQKHLIAQGKEQDATSVLTEKQRLQTSEDVLWAQGVLAGKKPEQQPDTATTFSPLKFPNRAEMKKMVMVTSDRYPKSISVEALAEDKEYFFSKWERERDVVMTHPLSPGRPGRIDFSGITTKYRGRLSLKLHRDNQGDCVAAITVGDETVKEVDLIGPPKWFSFEIPFDSQDVTVEVRAGGANPWQREFLYVAYTFKK